MTSSATSSPTRIRNCRRTRSCRELQLTISRSPRVRDDILHVALPIHDVYQGASDRLSDVISGAFEHLNIWFTRLLQIFLIAQHHDSWYTPTNSLFDLTARSNMILN